ncbi:unnamed protein product [Calicophoron daubneyi]|uniref:GRHL1/CP2 C-terminal domain-containing protein n=1 Tax=Calicophoron daubneyi TaxID=300641 RepID=A0AAV2TQC6_CALDB
MENDKLEASVMLGSSAPVIQNTRIRVSFGYKQEDEDGLLVGKNIEAGNLNGQYKVSTAVWIGRDMLRLTKDDFLSLCGAVEGLRLHNAFCNKPTRPRRTFYISRKEKRVYQAVMLYELTREELLRQIAPIISMRVDQIHVLCVLTAPGIPVFLSNELIAQLEDQSCFQIEVGWNVQHKANVFLRPV